MRQRIIVFRLTALRFVQFPGTPEPVRRKAERPLYCDCASMSNWCRDGFPFLGFRLLPTHARLARPNVVRFRRRLRQLHADYHAGLIDMETVNQSVQA